MRITSLGVRLAEAVARAGAVGAVVGVCVGEDREVAAVGLADAEHGQAMTADTRLPVASLTKPMVATALARQARREGRSLDAPLVDLVPDLGGDWRASRRISLRHLLSHTSGLRPDVAPDYPGTLDEAVRETVRSGQKFRVGAAWQYCNAGYALAGYTLGVRYGAGFEDALRAELFQPAGMLATGFDGERGAGHAGGSPVRATYAVARRPGGGVVSTVDAVLAFARFAMADPTFATTGVPVAASRLGGRYALGWTLARRGRVRWHAGDWGGCHSILLVMPARQAAVVLVVNDDAGVRLRRDFAWAELARVGGGSRPRVAPALWTAGSALRRPLAVLR